MHDYGAGEYYAEDSESEGSGEARYMQQNYPPGAMF